jgi:hypothetical protein
VTPRAQTGAVWILCALAWALFLSRVVVPAARNPNTDGFAAYYTEARVLIEDHRDLPRVYDDAWFQDRIDRLFERHVIDVIHALPPTMSLILAPLAWLPPATARAIWIAVNVLLWVAGLAVLLSALQMQSAAVPPLVVLSSMATIYTPLADNLRRGQGYVLMFFLLCLALRSLLGGGERKRWSGGVPLGLMMLLKGVGAWLWPLLAIGRRGRLVLAGAATVVVGAALASPVTGWQAWRLYVLEYHWMLSNPTSHVTGYQTLTSLFGHLLVFDAAWNPAPVAHRPVLAAVLTALVTTAAFIQSVRVQRLGAPGEEDRALTVGLFVSLMVSVAPLAEGYHYVLVFPAIVIAFWWLARVPHTRGRLWSLVACVALICVPQWLYGSPRLDRGWLALLAYPRLYGAFGLWAWHGRALTRSAVSARDLSARPGLLG